MKLEQLLYSETGFDGASTLGEEAQWVLVFGSKSIICNQEFYHKIRKMYPKAFIMGCSSAGEIHDNYAAESRVSVTAIALEKAGIEFKSYQINGVAARESYAIGKAIVSELPRKDLKHVFVLSEGLNINGSQFVDGMRSDMDVDVPITGGLAGDGTEFRETFVIANDYAKKNCIVLAALYGDVKTGCASVGGWDTFGIERLVTKSQDNILYEMDGKPALDLYKQYLGDKACELPASALLFPLSVRNNDSDESYVRTVLAVDEDKMSLIFAGDIPENSYCRLMKSNSNNLINGSMKAAELSLDMIARRKTELAILVSCVGRKLVLKQRIDEEIEVVRNVVGDGTRITGFYSYGEISPYKKDTACELHNQTMTVTFLSEE